jgi:enamine deaminase RidA (YjgF/YER057c/UK114 family)
VTEAVQSRSSIRRTQTDSPWEETIGFARAVAAGDRVLVSGTMPLVSGVLQGEGDPYEQAIVAFRNAFGALSAFGVGPQDVIRTRMYLTHARDVDAVSRAHKELFDAVRPAATLVVVSGFVDSRVLVEVEVEAFRGGDVPDGDRLPASGAETPSTSEGQAP